MSPVPSKSKRPNRPEKAQHVDGSSIYTCFRFHSHYNATDEDLDLHQRKTFSRRFNKQLQTRDGPWFMDLENVLERRDQTRDLNSKREQRKAAVRKIKRAQARSNRSRSVTGNSERDSVNSDADEDEQENERESTPTNKAKGPQSCSAGDHPSRESSQPAHVRDAELARLPEEVQSALPSSSLLCAIHHTATSFYTQKNVMVLPPARPGRRPNNWKEPVAMGQALHGSALMAIGILLEEIVKQDSMSSGEIRAD